MAFEPNMSKAAGTVQTSPAQFEHDASQKAFSSCTEMQGSGMVKLQMKGRVQEGLAHVKRRRASARERERDHETC